jgi:hypothetical protein
LGDAVHGEEGAADGGAGADRAAADEGTAGGVSLFFWLLKRKEGPTLINCLDPCGAVGLGGRVSSRSWSTRCSSPLSIASGIEAIHGNGAAPEVIAAANLGGARLLLVAIPDAFEAGQIRRFQRWRPRSGGN